MSSRTIAWGAFPFVNTAADFDVISILGHDLYVFLIKYSNALNGIGPPGMLARAGQVQFPLAFRDRLTKIAAEDRTQARY